MIHRRNFLMGALYAGHTLHFSNPNTNPTSTTFGRITGTTSDARNWQFALKLMF